MPLHELEARRAASAKARQKAERAGWIVERIVAVEPHCIAIVGRRTAAARDGAWTLVLDKVGQVDTAKPGWPLLD